MKDLRFQLDQLCHRSRDGSFGTREKRQRTLRLIAMELDLLGYRHMNINSLKPKHIDALINLWLSRNLSPRTIQNYMSFIRWWVEKIGKSEMLYANNSDYNIPQGSRKFKQSKAQFLSQEQLDRIPDVFVRASVNMQQHFGLRREESIKIQPSYADRGDHLALKSSWTKGGRAREIPVVLDEQHDALTDAHRVAGPGSLVAENRTFEQQQYRYMNTTKTMGLRNLHGLRHGYAQRRYQFLTGWPSPARSGPRAAQMTPEMKELDEQVRLQISRELGHDRIEITKVYLG